MVQGRGERKSRLAPLRSDPGMLWNSTFYFSLVICAVPSAITPGDSGNCSYYLYKLLQSIQQMLLVSCIPLTATLMLIHDDLVSVVGIGELKLSQLKRKSKEHYAFFPNNRYYTTPSETFLWKSLCCLRMCFLCSQMENSISSGVLPYLKTQLTWARLLLFKSGEKIFGTAVAGCENTSHPHQLTAPEEMILCAFTHYVRAQLTILWGLRM